jgi:lipid II:glycine glycyltransferase (peptidoglycan interpeptide bridge formation enzyme)
MIKEVSNPEEFNSLATHVTQSWEWGEFRSQTATVAKVIRLGSFRNEKLQRTFQVFFHKVPATSKTIGYLPRSVMPNSEELTELEEICKKNRAVFLKIEPITNYSLQLPEHVFVKGKPILPQHTFYVDLSKTEAELQAGLHEKTRYNIGLATRKGVVVREESNEAGMETFIKILTETEKRQKFFSHNENYYRLMWKTMEKAKIIHVLNAYIGDKPTASIVLFKFNDFLYYPYGGSIYEFRNLMSPQLLHWEAIKLGKKLKCKTYDLWGSFKNTPTEDDPWWGFYRLKAGLGGAPIDFPQTIDVVLSPLYRILMAAETARWKYLRLKSALLRK